MASSWLNFFSEKKKRKKKNSQKLSQLRHVELADECESIKTNTSYVLAGFMTHWRAGSRACSRLNFCEVFFFFFFFSLKKLSQLRGAEPATRRWASYVALSQLRGTEPATWHWASKVALSFELARRQWASKVALSFIIYIYIYIYTPMQSQPCNILDLGKSNFFEGDTYLWAGARDGEWNDKFNDVSQNCGCQWNSNQNGDMMIKHGNLRVPYCQTNPNHKSNHCRWHILGCNQKKWSNASHHHTSSKNIFYHHISSSSSS